MKLLALSLTLLVPAAFGADNAPDLQRKFVGSWKLISIEGPNQTSNGRPFGMIMYDSTGHMSVHIVRGDRPAFPNGRAKATDKEKAVAFDTYTAYYGTYTFDPENRIVIHHLEGSLSPGQIGQDNIRYFEPPECADAPSAKRRQPTDAYFDHQQNFRRAEIQRVLRPYSGSAPGSEQLVIFGGGHVAYSSFPRPSGLSSRYDAGKRSDRFLRKDRES